MNWLHTSEPPAWVFALIVLTALIAVCLTVAAQNSRLTELEGAAARQHARHHTAVTELREINRSQQREINWLRAREADLQREVHHVGMEAHEARLGVAQWDAFLDLGVAK